MAGQSASSRFSGRSQIKKAESEIGRHHMLTSVLHIHAHTCIHVCTQLTIRTSCAYRLIISRRFLRVSTRLLTPVVGSQSSS